MRIDNNETMKMYSPEYVKNVAQANKKAAADNKPDKSPAGPSLRKELKQKNEEIEEELKHYKDTLQNLITQ